MTIPVNSRSTVGEPAGVEVFPKGSWNGYSGSAGFSKIFPATAAKGSLNWACVNNAADYVITCVNASFGQASTITLPDPGAAAANFTLDTGVIAAGVGESSPGSLTGVSDTLKLIKAGVTYYIPLYAVNT